MSGATRLLPTALLGLLPGTALAARVPVDIRADISELHSQHGSPLVLLTEDPEVLKTLGKWLEKGELPHIARRMPRIGTRSYERQIALDRFDLRCGIEVDATWHLTPFGTCSPWIDGPSQVSAAVPRSQPTTERRRRFERGAAIAFGPVMSTGTVVDFSAEGRLSPRGSVAAIYSSIQVRDWGNPALMAVQARRYFIGDFDRGLYGLAQVGVLSTQHGTIHSPGIAAGLGLKYTTKPGLMVDGYLGAGPAYPVRIHPAVGGRLGWAF